MEKKEIVTVLKDWDLFFAVALNFLDVSFDLKTGSYKKFSKPTNEPRYINTDSNHLPFHQF